MCHFGGAGVGLHSAINHKHDCLGALFCLLEVDSGGGCFELSYDNFYYYPGCALGTLSEHLFGMINSRLRRGLEKGLRVLAI